MRKDYMESSIKRFLKRKVKITLGFVVAFMISGAVGYAEEADYKNEIWLEGIGTEKNITDKEIVLDSNHNIEIRENIVKITVNGKIEEIRLKDFSNKTFHSVETALENTDKVINGTLEDRLILSNGAKEEYDKYLNVSSNVKGNTALGIGKIKVVNGGILSDSKVELIALGEDGKITQYTDGDISSSISKSSTVALAKNNGVLINREIIDNDASLNYQPFLTAVNKSQIYNYGKIKVAGIAQFGIKNSSIYNYGEIDGGYNWNDAQIVGESSKAYNFGVIKGNQMIFSQSEGYNYGKLIGSQYVSDSKAYNYGVIIGQQRMNFYKGDKDDLNNNAKDYSVMVNYGYISGQQDIGSTSKTKGVEIFVGGEVRNYGIVSAQYIYNKNINADNFGIISNFSDTNLLTQVIDGEKITANNYGVIKNYDSDDYGQMILNSNFNTCDSVINNYGVIISSGGGQFLKKTNEKSHSNKSYNYGIISSGTGIVVENLDTTKEEDKNIGYNYGVLINKDGDATQGKVINNGIIIAKDNGTGEMIDGGVNNGVIYKDGKINIGADTFQLKEDKKLSEISQNNIFVNNINGDNQGSITVDGDKIEDKHITTIIGENSSLDKSVITKIGDLTLNNSSIVGYFEKEGTLLTVNGNLTLNGDSIINAIAGNEYTGYTGDEIKGVVAVEIAENGKLDIRDNSKVLGAVKGNGIIAYSNTEGQNFSNQYVDNITVNTTAGKTTDISFENIILEDSGVGVDNGGKFVIDNSSSKKLDEKEVSTNIIFRNNIEIEKGIDGTSSTEGIGLTLGDGQLSSDNRIKIDKISLGTGDDILTIQNTLKEVGVIDGNGGDDLLNLKNLTGKHNIFDYKLNNIETLDLGNSSWKVGKNLEISFANNSGKADVDASKKIAIQNGTFVIELKGGPEKVEFINQNSVDKLLGSSKFGESSKVKINIGKNMELIAGVEYDLPDTTVDYLKNSVGEERITSSAIFTKADSTDKDIRVKSAKEMEIKDKFSGIYDAMLKNTDKEEVLEILNSSSADEIAGMINGKGALGDTLSTTGYKITKDIINSFVSSVNEWDKKANRGEWLTNAKYISSDVEYDGANDVKGYDSNINSMVGMLEYGISEDTAVGVAFGGGDTEVDVNGAGTLDGNNYYIGTYGKHSIKGFDLVGNLGYTISDLDVDSKGSADSSAVTIGGYIKRDISLAESVRVEPNISLTYDYIMQDDAEGEGVKTEGKNIHVFETTVGMNIVKSFSFEKGLLEIKAGGKYSISNTNINEEPTVISLYNMEGIELGDPEIDKTRGSVHIGFDYEHENGVGVNGKYEMMWSESGDDSRFTAGVSYRF